ncbi:MAG: PBSX family phage terminase large subunit [Cetobacterium sp.]
MRINLSEKITPEFYESYKVFKNKDILEMVEYGGRGGGKSSNVFIFPIMRIIAEEIDCLVLRKVANTIRTSVFSQVIWCLGHLGISHLFKVNYSRMEIIYKPRGNGFYFKGADDPMKIKSLKTLYPVAITIFEEVDQFKTWDEVDHIKQSVLRGEIDHFKLIYLFNPPKNKYHWCNQKWLFGNTEGMYVHCSNFTQNPKLPIQFIKEAEKAKAENELRYRWIYMGEPIGSDIVPFPKLIVEKELDQKLIDSFDKINQGLDWGYGGDPFAFARTHYDKRNKILYIFGEIYGCGLGNSVTAGRIKKNGWDDTLTIADNNEPKSINSYNDDYGVPTEAAKKGAGSIETGLRWLGEQTIVVCKKRCPNGARELQMADFKVDKNGNITDKIEGADHFLDALRYATEEYWNYSKMRILD